MLSGFKELSLRCASGLMSRKLKVVKVGSQRPGDDYFSGAGNAKAIPFGQNKFGVHVRKPSSILCVCGGVFLRHTQLGLSRLNENHVFLGSG